jgi:hypothetical protein
MISLGLSREEIVARDVPIHTCPRHSQILENSQRTDFDECDLNYSRWIDDGQGQKFPLEKYPDYDASF